MIPISILDLSPIKQDQSISQSFAESSALAKTADELGFNRYWFAEHHNIPSVASAATAVLIGHIAGQTSRIRVGAGGIMLPNHAPLTIAEQFGTLEAIYPGRTDLGLGRAPGGDMNTARALRRTMHGSDDSFPRDVLELLEYFKTHDAPRPVIAIPGEGANVPVWILGSSLFGAQMAAHYGLPYAFASHFAPQMLEEAVHAYRTGFRPSEYMDQPYFMMACNVVAADTDDEAKLIFTSQQQAFINLRTGNAGPVPPPNPNFIPPPGGQAVLDSVLRYSAVGSAETVKARLSSFIDQVKPDELIMSASGYTLDARRRSLALVSETMGLNQPS